MDAVHRLLSSGGGRSPSARPLRALGLSLVVCALAGTAPASVSAQESLRLFNEPITYTDVPDAFDDEDPFDLNIRLGFTRMQETGVIQREQQLTVAGQTSTVFGDVADYEHLRNSLDVGLSLGLFHDVAAFVTLPVVLSDTRHLRPHGSDPAQDLWATHSAPSSASVDDARSRRDAARSACDDPMDGMPLACDDPDSNQSPHRHQLARNVADAEYSLGSVQDPLFNTNFTAATRSGVDQILFGLDLGIMNQMRTAELPTWTLHLEGRFGIGDAMQACADGDSTCSPGVSRGNNGFRIETRMSHRYRYIAPYGGIGFQIEWPGNADQTFLPSGNLSGFMNTKPPILGEFNAGVAIIPWEQKERWQRFVLDVRFHGRYVSEGRDYSPLFDALGSSSSPYLADPSCEGIPRNAADCNDAAAGGYRLVDFTGLTDTQGHGEYGLRLGLEMQAARYVRFGFGADLTWISSYIVTFTDACNPNVNATGADDGRVGSCRGGIINPHHRPAIDTPGSRFRYSDAFRFELFANATAQF